MNEASDAREEAIKQVEEHADAEWLGLAVRAIRYTAKHQSYFTTDDVWDLMETYGIKGPREPRAMAVAIRRAQDEGIIRRTDDYTSSNRKESHARPKRVWSSRIQSTEE
jgi:hypothetical protein